MTGVCNLASPASPPDYLALPLETLAVGSDGTRHGLELAERHGARFLMASTSEVYGDPDVHPQPETYWGNVNPVGPRSVYDEAKRFSEALTMAHHRTRGHRCGHRPHLQHLRTTPSSRRRPGGRQLPPPGHAGRTAHRLRRRQPDPQPLLCRGRGPGPARAVRLGADRTRQHRQSGRVHGAGAGQDGHRSSRLLLRRSNTDRSRPTTPPAADPTSRWPGPNSAGNRPPASRTGLARTAAYLAEDVGLTERTPTP